MDLDGKRLKFDPNPVYLGITLDWSLTFAAHAKKVAAKSQARVNLVRKLAGTPTTWGANFTTLHISALALVYPTAEYAAPVWARSTHTKLVDVALNDAYD